MLAQVHSFVLQGIEAQACEIEVDLADRGIAKPALFTVELKKRPSCVLTWLFRTSWNGTEAA